MKCSIIVSLCVELVPLVGCVDLGMTGQINNGRAKLVPDTINATPYGANYKITGLVQAGEQRDTLSVYATDCSEGYGVITSNGGADDVYIKNVLASGAKPADKLFADMCHWGLPIVEQMDSLLTDQQRADRLHRTQRAVAAELASEAARREQRNHDDAIRDAGDAVAGAIDRQRSRTITCNINAAGYTCSQ